MENTKKKFVIVQSSDKIFVEEEVNKLIEEGYEVFSANAFGSDRNPTHVIYFIYKGDKPK